MSATRGAPRTSSSGAKSRPSATRTPSTRRKLCSTGPHLTPSGCSSAMTHVHGIHGRHRLERRRGRVPHLHVALVGHALDRAESGQDVTSPTETRRSGSAYGSGLKSTRSSAAKSAVEAPRPSPSTRMAASANPGRRRHERQVNRASCRSASHHSAIQTRRLLSSDDRLRNTLPFTPIAVPPHTYGQRAPARVGLSFRRFGSDLVSRYNA